MLLAVYNIIYTMKLRCTENSIRLRVRKSDLHTLVQEGLVREVVNLPGSVFFSFELITAEVDHPKAGFQDNCLRVTLPKAQSDQWINSDQVGIEHLEPLVNGHQLHILIEKDFPCKDREDEDKTDTFQELVQENGEKC